MQKQVQFDKVLKELRKEKGLTQAQLGELLNVTYGCINGWENRNREPGLKMLWELAQIFEVTVGQLLGVEDY